MNQGEETCVCLACTALCGICCMIAVEEDRRDRERENQAKAAALQKQSSACHFVEPVPVPIALLQSSPTMLSSHQRQFKATKTA